MRTRTTTRPTLRCPDGAPVPKRFVEIRSWRDLAALMCVAPTERYTTFPVRVLIQDPTSAARTVRMGTIIEAEVSDDVGQPMQIAFAVRVDG